MGFLKDLIVREPYSDNKQTSAGDVAILEMRYERECEEFTLNFFATKQEWEEEEKDQYASSIKSRPR